MSEAAKIRHSAIHAIVPRCTVEQIIFPKMVLCSRQAQAHQGASQASHLRLCPGGGGVSPNRMPFLSVRVPSLKKPGPLEDAFDRKLRSARTGTRDSDIAVGGAKDVQGLLLRGPQHGPLQRLHHLPCLKRGLLLESDAAERSEALQKWSGTSDRHKGTLSAPDIIPAHKPSFLFPAQMSTSLPTSKQCDKRAETLNRIASFHKTHHQQP